MPRPRARIDPAALADAFAGDGIHGTSAAAVARAVGVAKPTLYVHGTTKDALFLLAVESEVERVLDRLQAARGRSAGQSARERATAAVLALLDHAADRPHGRRLLAATAHHDASTVAPAVAAALTRLPDRLTVDLRRDLQHDGLDAELAPFLARGLYGAALAVGEARPAERRPARLRLARAVAAIVPEPAGVTAADWPSA